MAPTMIEPARFWAFVEDLERKGGRPSEIPANASAGTDVPAHKLNSQLHGFGRGGRGGGRGWQRARMQQSREEKKHIPCDAPEELTSDDDFIPVATPVEPVNEKQPLFDEVNGVQNEDLADHINVDNNNISKSCSDGLGDRVAGRRGRGRRGAGLRGDRTARQGFHGCRGTPGACGGAHRFGLCAGPHRGSFQMNAMRKALNSNNLGTQELSTNHIGLNGSNTREHNSQKARAHKAFKPRADVFESPNYYNVNFALPGVKSKDMQLVWRPRRGVLFVSGRIPRKAEDMSSSQVLIQSERAAGRFERRVALSFPSSAIIDANSIFARLQDGVLSVDVPKFKGDKPFSGPVKLIIV